MTVIGVEAKNLGFIWYPGGKLWCYRCDYFVPFRYSTVNQLRAMRMHHTLCTIIAWRDLNQVS